jgi:hypothetical protein
MRVKKNENRRRKKEKKKVFFSACTLTLNTYSLSHLFLRAAARSHRALFLASERQDIEKADRESSPLP